MAWAKAPTRLRAPARRAIAGEGEGVPARVLDARFLGDVALLEIAVQTHSSVLVFEAEEPAAASSAARRAPGLRAPALCCHSAWAEGRPQRSWRPSMGLSWWHILLVLLVFVLLFGTGKISGLMGDVAKGIKSFKQGMAEDDEDKPEPEPTPPGPKVIEHKATKPATGRTKSAVRAKAPRTPKTS